MEPKYSVIICDLDHKDIDTETEIFQKNGVAFARMQCDTEEELIAQCKGARVFLNQYTKMNEKVFRALPELKCVIRYGVGYDNINVEDATRYGVQICNIPDYGTNEVADQALAMTMALARKISLSNKLIREGTWDYQTGIPIFRLSECTVGICGVGRIGSAYAHRIRALGSKIIAYDPEYGKEGREFPEGIEFVSFDELLERSDILSVHCLLNEDSYHMFGKKEFEKMKSTAYFINVSRGALVDEDALYEALQNKRIAGAGLDVVCKEPLSQSSLLLKFTNFLISPHTAWYSEQSAIELKRKCAEEAVRFLAGQPVHYPVNQI